MHQVRSEGGGMMILAAIGGMLIGIPIGTLFGIWIARVIREKMGW